MTKIPIVSEEAMIESYTKFQKAMTESIGNGNTRKMKQLLKTSSTKLSETQPEIFEFISNIMESHLETTGGFIIAPQLALYVMVIINSLYVQEEIDGMNDLFKEEK